MTDVIATASLVGGQFGKGGGGEVGSALMLEKATAKFAAEGENVFTTSASVRIPRHRPRSTMGTHSPTESLAATDENVALPDAGTTVQEPGW